MARKTPLSIQPLLSELVLEFELPQEIEQALVDLELVSKRKMRSINARYRSIDEPTDVLSFPLYTQTELKTTTQPLVPILLGTLVLCPEMIEHHVKDSGRSVSEQLTWSIRHGLMHLLGFDHPPDDEHWFIGKDAASRPRVASG